MKELSLPFEIPKEKISLPTGGAAVTKMERYHLGDPDPSPVAQAYGRGFTAEVYRIEGEIYPVDPDAPKILFAAAMPTDWNGKAVQQGGSGVNGFVPPSCGLLHGQDRVRDALSQGYVVFGGDSGHEILNGNMLDCSWMRNRECFENFAYLSLKKTKDVICFLIEQIYGKAPDKVYFYGGSNGGRECMKAIQNYPDDYDGAVCFFPVLYWVLKILKDSGVAQAYERIGEAGFIDEETYDRVITAAMDLCDGLDGEKDQVIGNWREADEMRPQVEEAVKGFLSPEQFEMLDILSQPMTLSFPLAYGDTQLVGYQSFAGAPLASQFTSLRNAQKIGYLSISDNIISNIFAQDPSCDPRNFIPEERKERILAISRWMDASDPDLDRYVQKGGKLILVQGTVDPQVVIYGTENYFHKLVNRYGQNQTDQFMRYYVMPGYGHGTDGTFLIRGDFLGLLDNWSEKGEAPEKITVMDDIPEHNGRTREILPVSPSDVEV